MMNNICLGIPDEDFIRGGIPMTKEEVRTIALAKLQLTDGMTVVDVGAGTGSISIEVAGLIPNGKVYAVEMKEEGIRLIKENSIKFQRYNIEPIHGKASTGLKSIPSNKKVDRLFIGGVGEELESVLEWADKYLHNKGRIVMNMILMESFDQACRALRVRGYKVEACRLQVERLKVLGQGHYFSPLNSVFILWADKKE